jgi:hypothetical protein
MNLNLDEPCSRLWMLNLSCSLLKLFPFKTICYASATAMGKIVVMGTGGDSSRLGAGIVALNLVIVPRNSGL